MDSIAWAPFIEGGIAKPIYLDFKMSTAVVLLARETRAICLATPECSQKPICSESETAVPVPNRKPKPGYESVFEIVFALEERLSVPFCEKEFKRSHLMLLRALIIEMAKDSN